jgi:hypothetical protein
MVIEDESGIPSPDTEPEEPMNETSTCQQGSTCKRQAMEEITNGPKQ